VQLSLSFVLSRSHCVLPSQTVTVSLGVVLALFAGLPFLAVLGLAFFPILRLVGGIAR